jgi:nucleoside-diphosphate-sugar epimerase
LNNWLIFGAGFSGLEIGRKLAISGHQVAGTTRSMDKFSRLEQAGVQPLQFDGSEISRELIEHLHNVTHLIMSIGPDDGGDPLLPSNAQLLAQCTPNLRWVGYLSTVGVYGDHDGAWVDEETVCRPVSKRSIDRLRTEVDWQDFAKQREIPLCILRLSGIYGTGRNGFVNLTNGTAKRVLKPGQVFNRIHVDDIAGAVIHLSSGNKSGVFNVTDNEPAPPQDVVIFCASLMGISPPPEIAYDDAKMSPMARSFYGEVKRVSNTKLRTTGYTFSNPDYRTAFTKMWQTDRWK